MIEKTVVVEDPSGLHARRARELVDEVSRFQSEITIIHDGEEASGQSIMEIMMLAAQPGAQIDLVIDGADENKASDQLETFFQRESQES